jgi:hypothetical protein
MPPVTRWLTTLLVYTTAFVGAGLFATACDPSYTITSFRCDPKNPDCPTDKYGTGTYVCCSDDATAIDLDNPNDVALPRYVGKNGTGIPLFSGPTNHLSRSGYCIDTSAVPPTAAIADPGTGQGCPLPCNPTWSSSQVAAICGGGSVCCQTQELGDQDCGLDPDAGNGGCWRPVTGTDISGLGGLDVSTWASSDHDTHQDPGGGGCQAFVELSAGAISSSGLTVDQARIACFRKLSVADQRGFCQSGVCPLTAESYRDACQRKNDAEGRTGC